MPEIGYRFCRIGEKNSETFYFILSSFRLRAPINPPRTIRGGGGGGGGGGGSVYLSFGTAGPP